jgi:hypothetical protein
MFKYLMSKAGPSRRRNIKIPSSAERVRVLPREAQITLLQISIWLLAPLI